MSLRNKVINIVFITAIIKFNLFNLAECRRVKRVIGGMEVDCGTLIGIASLRNTSDSRHLCGVTVLTRYLGITSAHCVPHKAESYSVYLNNYCNKDKKTTPRAQVLEVIRHPWYNRMTGAYDIAVLRLQLDLDDVTWLDDITLSTSAFGLSGECTIYGYGYTDLKTKQVSEKLLAANVKLISLDECTRILGQYVAPEYGSGMMCALGDGVDACQGDSGAPLICAGKIEGISSYGVSCGLPGIPGVYTSTGFNYDWLRGFLDDIKLISNSYFLVFILPYPKKKKIQNSEL